MWYIEEKQEKINNKGLKGKELQITKQLTDNIMQK